MQPQTSEAQRKGPLAGMKIVELAGIGPAPMCAMLLADLGATVLRIDRPQAAGLGIPRPLKFDLVLRSRGVIQIDLKSEAGLMLAHELIAEADALIEGFRPGTTERMGLGPDVCRGLNPKLVYGRMTGWGQDGPLAQAAGHDLNYIAITGVQDAIGRTGQAPAIPLNLIGDYAGGAMYLAMGLLAAIIEARNSGKGQVVDAAMVDGVLSLATFYFGLSAAGIHKPQRESNVLDGGAPFYNLYECADGKWISIAPIEPKFYEQLLRLLGLKPAELGDQNDCERWPHARTVLATKFKTRTRAEWTNLLEGTDACFSPMLDFREATEHPQLKARGSFVEIDGITQPAPAPRFSRTPTGTPTAPAPPGTANADAALEAWLPAKRIAELRRLKTIA